MISHSAHKRQPQLANPIAESHPTVWIKTNIARWQRILYAKCSTGTFPKNDRYEIAGSRISVVVRCVSARPNFIHAH